MNNSLQTHLAGIMLASKNPTQCMLYDLMQSVALH